MPVLLPFYKGDMRVGFGHPQDMRKRWFRWGVLLVVLLPVVLVGLFLRPVPERKVTLTSGLTVKYLGTTYGTNHVLPGFSRLTGLLPRPVRAWFGLSQGMGLLSSTPEYVVWLRADSRAAPSPLGPSGMECLVTDEQGVFIGADSNSGPGLGGTFPLKIQALPCRSREIKLKFFERVRVEGFGLRLMSVSDLSEIPDSGNELALVARNLKDGTLHFRAFDREGRLVLDNSEGDLPGGFMGSGILKTELTRFWERESLSYDELAMIRMTLSRITGQMRLHQQFLGELTLANPAFVQAPAWEGEPMPAQRTNGGLSCRLERLAAGVGNPLISNPGLPRAGLQVLAPEMGRRLQAVGVFHFEEDGRPSRNWEVGSVRLADAAGHSIRPGFTMRGSYSDREVRAFDPILWPNEVWDLTVWAERKPEAVFSDEELIVLENVEVPASGRIVRLDRVFQRLGIEVRVKELVHERTSGPVGRRMSGRARLLVELPELPDEMCLKLVVVVDEQGRRLLVSGQPLDRSGKHLFMAFPVLVPAEGAKTLTIRLALQKRQRFDFRVKPEGVGMNGFQLRVKQ
ncbi:MAG: hypothetical protein KDM81_02285 [Verrucomicrobiae bacterium]|nr:hypothetical protein [Verrucomicrobiae bacterium]